MWGIRHYLQPDKHDNIGFALLQIHQLLLISGRAAAEHAAELVHDSLLNDLALVEARALVCIVGARLDVGAQIHDQLDVDICLQQGCGDLLQAGIQDLHRGLQR